jgi:hypothetical protein
MSRDAGITVLPRARRHARRSRGTGITSAWQAALHRLKVAAELPLVNGSYGRPDDLPHHRIPRAIARGLVASRLASFTWRDGHTLLSLTSQGQDAAAFLSFPS